MIHRPSQIGAFEFVVMAGLRAEQLRRGCIPRIDGDHKRVVTAQLEVVTGKVVRELQGAVQETNAEKREVEPLAWDLGLAIIEFRSKG